MNTILKTRAPSSRIQKKVTTTSENADTQLSTPDDVTIEQYLRQEFEKAMKVFYDKTDDLIKQINDSFDDETRNIESILHDSGAEARPISVTLECNAGPHEGETFHLSVRDGCSEDKFKIGRSKGKLFITHGVSLSKDGEISTTHATIQIRSNSAFVMDCNSTNGTKINDKDVKETESWIKLAQDDVISMGSTRLRVIMN